MNPTVGPNADKYILPAGYDAWVVRAVNEPAGAWWPARCFVDLARSLGGATVWEQVSPDLLEKL